MGDLEDDLTRAYLSKHGRIGHPFTPPRHWRIITEPDPDKRNAGIEIEYDVDLDRQCITRVEPAGYTESFPFTDALPLRLGARWGVVYEQAPGRIRPRITGEVIDVQPVLRSKIP